MIIRIIIRKVKRKVNKNLLVYFQYRYLRYHLVIAILSRIIFI